MDIPTSQRLDIVIPAYRMHSQSFHNALQGISEGMALKRMDSVTNHVVWMAGNLVNCRYWMADLLGMPDKDPNEQFFREGRALDETLPYPSLSELKEHFSVISPKVYKALLEVTDVHLQKSCTVGMDIPFIKENVLNMIGLCIGREDYLLGQIGLMRKMLGLKGMSYDLDGSLTY